MGLPSMSGRMWRKASALLDRSSASPMERNARLARSPIRDAIGPPAQRLPLPFLDQKGLDRVVCRQRQSRSAGATDPYCEELIGSRLSGGDKCQKPSVLRKADVGVC